LIQAVHQLDKQQPSSQLAFIIAHTHDDNLLCTTVSTAAVHYCAVTPTWNPTLACQTYIYETPQPKLLYTSYSSRSSSSTSTSSYEQLQFCSFSSQFPAPSCSCSGVTVAALRSSSCIECSLRRTPVPSIHSRHSPE
jgi:hypothetical protein